MRSRFADEFKVVGTRLKEHARISNALAVNAAAVRSARRELRCMRRRMKAQSERMHRICFVLFVWSSPSATMSLAFAEQARRQGKSVPNITADMLQEEYLQTSIEEIADIMSGEQIRPGVLRAALNFAREHELHEWIHEQNVTKGVAPSNDRILKEAERLEEGPEKVTSLQRIGRSEPARTKWMQRFKRRWMIKRGRIQPGECVPQSEAQAKVPGEKK